MRHRTFFQKHPDIYFFISTSIIIGICFFLFMSVPDVFPSHERICKITILYLSVMAVIVHFFRILRRTMDGAIYRSLYKRRFEIHEMYQYEENMGDDADRADCDNMRILKKW